MERVRSHVLAEMHFRFGLVVGIFAPSSSRSSLVCALGQQA